MGLALVSVIPILVLLYIHAQGVPASPALGIWYVIIYLIVLAMGLTGFFLLHRHPSHLVTLRTRLEKTVQRELPGTALKEASPDDVAAIDRYLTVLIEGLKAKVGTEEEEKARLQQQLFQAQKIESLGAMATGMAHDFNNCLAAIVGNISIAIRDLPESPAREHARQAESVALRAVDIANHLLLAAGRGRMAPEKLDLSAVVQDAMASVKSAVPENVTIDSRLSDSMPPITGDREQIRQAIAHLIVNAAESYLGAPGAVRVTTGSIHYGRDQLSRLFLDMNLPDDIYAYVEVADQGSGIAPDLHSRMFDPFFTTKLRGPGMGLAIVQGVARAHFAGIKVDTAIGQGSSFRLLFQTSRNVVDAL